MTVPNVNLVAVVVATVASMALGFLWYAPFFLGKQWLSALGKTQEQLGSQGPAYALTLVFALITAYVTGAFAKLANVTSPGDGALVGLVAGIGFVVTSFGSAYVFEGQGRRLFFINAGFYVVTLVVMGAIHGLIR